MTFEISKISIPKEPGIYLMKDSKGEIIYIGKAKNLKNRVKSYFLKNQNYKTQKLVSKMFKKTLNRPFQKIMKVKHFYLNQI